MAHQLWFITDTHFGHANILTFTKGDGGPLIRPGFANIEEHDERIVESWNAVVRPQDKVYHLGDVTMHKAHLATVRKLNGHKRLLRGNHDIFRTRDYLACGFEEIAAYRVLDRILFSHIPINAACMGRFRCNAHGHLHATPSPNGKFLNLCPEWRGYAPLPFEEVQQLVSAMEVRRANEEEAACMGV